ncbi:MAG: GDP-mannose 4,6-dehydratase [Candidatus Omnitrophica bacterium]|nr:GDP-mannose 4,6-dehydratase [Candidatus Omnitrophota bacterium]
MGSTSSNLEGFPALKILITGGAGFIGSNLARHYLKRGEELTILDNLSRPGVERNLQALQRDFPQLRFLKTDIRDGQAFPQPVEGQDVVFHMAAQVAVTTSIVDPLADFEVNALGTLNLLEAVRQSRSQPILIYASTNKVYGDLARLPLEVKGLRYEPATGLQSIDESCPLDFHSPYACSKGSGDQYVRDYARLYDLRTVVLRQSCIYGPGQHGSVEQGWVSWMLRAAMESKPVTVFGSGRQVRDVLYIGDLVEACDLVIQNISRTSGQIYNIGGGIENSISILEYLQLLDNKFGCKILPEWAPARLGDQRFFVADIGKAKRDFGWAPKTSVAEGVSRLLAWMKEGLTASAACEQ